MRRGRFGQVGAGLLLVGLTLSGPSLADVTTVEEPPPEGTPTTPADGDVDEVAESESTAPPETTGDRVAAVEDPDGDRSTPSDAELDARIAALREERRQYGLGGPITMLAVGGGVALGAVYVHLITQAACLGECETSPAVVVVGAVGLGVGIWGGVLLGERIGERRRNGREIQELESQKAGVEVSVLPAVGPDAAALHVRLAF